MSFEEGVTKVIPVGIDSLAIYTSRYAFSLADLAIARGVNTDKFQAGLGQYMMSVAPPGEDIVTMAANAAKKALYQTTLHDIDMLLFATESGIDQSKAAGTYVHELLGLPPRCRIVELKQACYSGTAAIQLALPYLRENPTKKILVIAADIARYGLNTTGESSQGAGAVAMILSANPRLIAFDKECGIATENAMDFWRPNYLHEALVDGKYSSKLYLTMLEKTWQQYTELSRREFRDHAYHCYHIPVPRLVEKAHHYLMKLNGEAHVPEEVWSKEIDASLIYSRQMGNSYTASLYVGLASLLDHVTEDLSNKRIGFYSYGSGCVAEYFSGVVQPGYRDALLPDYHSLLLSNRTQLTYDEYAQFYQFHYVEDGSQQEVPIYNTGAFRLTRIAQHKRFYEKVESLSMAPIIRIKQQEPEKNKQTIIKIQAPGKLILSGEHAVVHGNPAIAMAINRYVTATVTEEKVPHILLHLADLAHDSRLSLDALRSLKDRIKRKYHGFIRGDYSIRDVLQKPFELAQFALSVFAESLHIPIPNGVNVHVKSDLPMGCGMGSSAATIISVMEAVSHYLQKPLSSDMLFKLALEAENMQHGYSSGLDLRIAQQGGCLYLHDQQIESRLVPDLPMYLINTGTPITTTGQCVEAVSSHFQSSLLKDEFAHVTKKMDEALQQQSLSRMQEAMKENHRLLIQIGVVPQRVQQFIAAIELEDAAAKVCGAGAIAGDQAGAVLVLSQDETSVKTIAQRFGYTVTLVTGESRGAHAA